MRPRVHFPGHVVASGRLVRRSPTIDGGNNRNVDPSWLETRHGGQCWHGFGSRLCLVFDAAVLRCCCPRVAHGTDRTGSVSACSARKVCFECSRVTTKCGLSSHDFFPRDITPPVTGEFAKLNIFLVTGKIYDVTNFSVLFSRFAWNCSKFSKTCWDFFVSVSW